MEDLNLSSGQKAAFTRLKNEMKQEAKQLMDGIREKEKAIDELINELLEDDDSGVCVNTQIKNVENEVFNIRDKTNEVYGKIEGIHKDITAEDGLLEKVKSNFTQIATFIAHTSEHIADFKKSYSQLYGSDDEPGLESRLESISADHKAYLENLKLKSDELIRQVEGALTGATNVELAKAFQDQRSSYGFPKILWQVVFLGCIVAMLGVSYMMPLNVEGKIDYTIELIKRLPLFGPLVWLAIFASKQQSQSKRLEEEYIHKETIAKSYVGHKKQIENLNDGEDKDKLIIKLAERTIQAIAFNPSSTLDRRSHSDGSLLSKIVKPLTPEKKD